MGSIFIWVTILLKLNIVDLMGLLYLEQMIGVSVLASGVVLDCIIS